MGFFFVSMSTPPGLCIQLQRTRLMVGNISSVPVTLSCLNHLNCSCHPAFKQVGPSSPAQGVSEEEREREREKEGASVVERAREWIQIQRSVLARTEQQISKVLFFTIVSWWLRFKVEMKTPTRPCNPVGRCCIALFSVYAVKVHISHRPLWSPFSAAWSNKHPTLAEDTLVGVLSSNWFAGVCWGLHTHYPNVCSPGIRN